MELPTSEIKQGVTPYVHLHMRVFYDSSRGFASVALSLEHVKTIINGIEASDAMAMVDGFEHITFRAGVTLPMVTYHSHSLQRMYNDHEHRFGATKCLVPSRFAKVDLDDLMSEGGNVSLFATRPLFSDIYEAVRRAHPEYRPETFSYDTDQFVHVDNEAVHWSLRYLIGTTRRRAETSHITKHDWVHVRDWLMTAEQVRKTG